MRDTVTVIYRTRHGELNVIEVDDPAFIAAPGEYVSIEDEEGNKIRYRVQSREFIHDRHGLKTVAVDVVGAG